MPDIRDMLGLAAFGDAVRLGTARATVDRVSAPLSWDGGGAVLVIASNTGQPAIASTPNLALWFDGPTVTPAMGRLARHAARALGPRTFADIQDACSPPAASPGPGPDGTPVAEDAGAGTQLEEAGGIERGRIQLATPAPDPALAVPTAPLMAPAPFAFPPRAGWERMLIAETSARCSLDCSYCIHRSDHCAMSMSRGELHGLLDLAGAGRPLLACFSGVGDFFAGYSPGDRLLSSLLDRPDLGLFLDVNGVQVHEADSLTRTQWSRLRHLNLTTHYPALRSHGLLERWAANAERLVRATPPDTLLSLNTVLSPDSMDSWEASIRFHERTVFARTGARLALLTDARRRFAPAEADAARALLRAHPDSVCSLTEEDYSATYAPARQVWCAMGHTAFVAALDGSITGCPFSATPEVLGNWHEGRLDPRPGRRPCTCAGHFECALLGTTGFVSHDPQGRHPAAPTLPPLYLDSRLRRMGIRRPAEHPGRFAPPGPVPRHRMAS